MLLFVWKQKETYTLVAHLVTLFFNFFLKALFYIFIIFGRAESSLRRVRSSSSCGAWTSLPGAFCAAQAVDVWDSVAEVPRL